MALTGEAFIDRLNYMAKAWLPGRDIVLKYFSQRTLSDPVMKRIFVLEEYAPWQVGCRVFRIYMLANRNVTMIKVCIAGYRKRKQLRKG